MAFGVGLFATVLPLVALNVGFFADRLDTGGSEGFDAFVVPGLIVLVLGIPALLTSLVLTIVALRNRSRGNGT